MTAPLCKSLTLLFFGLRLAAQQASLNGIVSSAESHEALAGVHIRLFIERLGAPSAAYGAMSDRTGHFSIATIAPGTYNLVVERSGFAYTGQPRLALKAAQNLTGLKLEMTPLAVISGRVLDSNGEPVQKATIDIVPVAGGNSRVEIPQADATNEKGEFRAVAAPGRYYVEAFPSAGLNLNSAEILAPGEAQPYYVGTWFPGATSKDRAMVVEAIPGQETGGIDIHLASQRPLKISGVLKGLPEGTGYATILAQGPDNRPYVANAAGGKFTLDGLTAGKYSLSVFEVAGLSAPRVQVTLENADVTDLELKLQGPEKLTGTLEAPGDVTKMSVTLAGSGTDEGGGVDRNGAFSIPGVLPGRYRVSVSPLPGNSYIKEVSLDGIPAEGMLDLSKGVGGSKLKVVVSPDGGELSGSVRTSAGDQLSNIDASVILAPDAKEIRVQDTFAIAADGTYIVHGVRPGKYRLFAIDNSPYNRANDLSAIAAKAAEIEIKPGDRLTKDLTLAETDAR